MSFQHNGLYYGGCNPVIIIAACMLFSEKKLVQNREIHMYGSM